MALLIHGHTQSPIMWRAAAEALAEDGWFVVAPDLHLRDRPEGVAPPTKADLAKRFDALLTAVARPASVTVGHDLGAMVAATHAARNRTDLRALAVLEATPPGVGFWSQLLADPRAWHFNAHGSHMEKLIEGREEIYLDRFWTEFAGDGRDPIPAPDRAAYISALREPGALRAALGHFAVFPADAEAADALFADPLQMPVLAIGGERSFGAMIAEQMRLIATDVAGHVVPDAGHWLLEEDGPDTIVALRRFLAPHLASSA
ncbi:alpha/beta fold hydrolase [Aestuariibius insulae]|uniref:alpha/beta fold hydrolase n=1 Tax=Aestuariibius insulae TaxID=2058287 RepID=UPI00345E4CD3